MSLNSAEQSQPTKKFCTPYGIQKIVATFTRAHHLCLSWAQPLFLPCCAQQVCGVTCDMRDCNVKYIVLGIMCVLTYGAKTWSFYEDDRWRINATETDELRRSARISKQDRKTNEYILGKK